MKKGQKVKILCSGEELRKLGVKEKHIKHILGKTGTVMDVREIKEAGNTEVCFVKFHYVRMKPAAGNKEPCYAFPKSMVKIIK